MEALNHFMYANLFRFVVESTENQSKTDKIN